MGSLLELYVKNQENVSDKWLSYLHYYDHLLQPYKDRPIRILEVGIQNGGSLDIWAKFFPNAECIVGCDIDPKCADIVFHSPKVKVVIGDATQDDVLDQVRAHCCQFDIIIDDGSHRSSDIIRTFAKVFPMIVDDGLYICEDLHCSYFSEFEGGLENPDSSQAFFRRLSDYVNHQHWSGKHAFKAPLHHFERVWDISIPEHVLHQIYSVGFSNSICHIEKRKPQEVLLQSRIVRGRKAVVSDIVQDFDAEAMPSYNQPTPAPFGSIEEMAKNYERFNDLQRDLQRLQREYQQQQHEYQQVRQALQNDIQQERNQRIFQEGLSAGLKADLAKARRHPLEPLKDKINFKFLKAILNSGLPLSGKTRARFNNSARKRDPMRSLTAVDVASVQEPDYGIWMRKKEPEHHLTEAQVQQINTKAQQDSLTISAIMPVYNPAPKYLEMCILSVLKQSFQNWQLCIADDASTDPEVHAVLRKYAQQDERIVVTFREENGHISAASNSALETATGAYVALLDHDDALPEHALAHVAQALQDNPTLQLVYSDEDKLNNEGRRIEPHFKSDWNRDLFYSHNYITHLCVIDRAVLTDIGGFRVGYEGAQDYDLLLRIVAKIPDENIHHIAKILYHWRAHEGSTANAAEAKSYTHVAGKRALEDFMYNAGHEGVIVNDGVVENMFHVSWPLPEVLPKVSIIIPTRDYLRVLRTAVLSILEKTTYSNYEIVIVDNGSVEQETLNWFETMQGQHANLRVLPYDAPFNYSAINNFAVDQVDADIIALVNNDIEVISPDWLSEMVSHAVREDIGCVGAKLYYTNGQIQHGGVIIGIGGMAGHSHKYFDGQHHGYFSRLLASQNLSAVTAACLVMRRTLFQEVGGLDADNLAVAFNDVDLCLKVQAAGYRNLWSPYAELFHHESISRGAEDTPEKKARFQKEVEFAMDKWKPDQVRDRYYNPNLTLKREDFSLNMPDA